MTPTWVRGMALRERPRRCGEPVDRELARRRWQRWQAQAPFGDGDLLRERLRLDDLDEAVFLTLLGEPSDHLVQRLAAPPDWVPELLAAYDHAHEFSDRWSDEFAILAAVEPLLERARARVSEAISPELAHQATMDSFERLLPARLFPILARTVAHELQEASRSGALPGDSPAHRFRAFVEYLAEGGARDLFEAYPVLGRQVATCVTQWADACIEFLSRMSVDRELLASTFGAAGGVNSIVGGLNDPHAGGREVLIVGFGSGTKVVYKPKPLSVDRHFQGFLDWLNARGQEPALRTLAIAHRGEYGWVEFVEARPWSTRDEVERFYRRQGSLLAVLHVLVATDLHFENIVRAGEDPVVIDLEALFHPSLRKGESSSAFESALAAMERSVLSVGMLPQPMRLSLGGPSVDVSALGASEGQLSPRGVPRWVGGATDGARIEYERVPVGVGEQRPNVEGQPVRVLDHMDAVLSGFEHTYGLLLDARADLLRADGPLSAFEGDTIRLLLRPTVVYARLLAESYQPDLQRDGLERDRFLDRLWVAVPNQPRLMAAIGSEQTDLWRGDIPKFTTRPTSRLISGSLNSEIDGVIEAPGMVMARARIEALGPEDLERQRWFIRAAFGSLADAPEQSAPLIGRDRAQPASVHELLDGARRIGDRLAELAIRGEDDATWLGLVNGSVQPLGADLYSGLPGVVLFLAYLGELELARAGLRRLERQLADGLAPLEGVGAFGGWGGLVYAYAHLARVLGEPELLEAAHAIVSDRLPPMIAADERFDIADGVAGCIGALAALYGTDPRACVASAIAACGERLLSHVPTLTGFAHGAAGHAWALDRAFEITGDRRFGSAAEQARIWENGLYSEAAGNWPDLRYPGAPRFMVAWCHGAAGIGLSRVEPRALMAVRGAPPRANHSLCHGELGNLEMLPQQEARLRAAAVLAAPTWVCATPFGVESPGLMTGLAGIGYGLLRLAKPERVPSVLRLEAPFV